MSNLVIVAIPAEDDYVWKISSEKKPHCTLLFLGDVESNPNAPKITEFVEHAVNILNQGPFMLRVDHRDVLGDDEADVVFFKKNWDLKRLTEFRGALLKDNNIRSAYEAANQFPEWQPHLTLGYPATPAHEDTREYPGLRWIDFDKIAVWSGDFEGPEFRLEYAYDLFEAEMSMASTQRRGEAFLAHYGVKGMRWGQRREPPSAVNPSARSVVPQGTRSKTKVKVAGGENHPAHEDAIKVAEARAKLSKSGAAALSNHELRNVATRLQLEAQVKQLSATGGQKFVANLLKQQGQQSAQSFVRKKAQEKGF